MSKVLITQSLLDDLADAIAAKSGESTPLTIAEMTEAVEDIPAPIDTSDANAVAGDMRSGKSGYVNGVKVTGNLPERDDTDLTASGDTVTVPPGIYDAAASKSVAAGTEGTPVATKGAVSNHAMPVTPSVTNGAGFIAGGTKTGTPVTVSASELVSGSETKTQNGTYDVTDLAEIVVAVPAPAFSTIRTGSGPPSSSLGVDGDIYIQTS